MISYADKEQYTIINSVFFLVHRMETYKLNPTCTGNNRKLKQYINKTVESLKEHNQFLLDVVYDYLGCGPKQRYNLTELKKLHDTL